MSIPQRVVVTAAALPLVGIAVVSTLGAFGVVSENQMIETALTFGEEPGMFVLAAMLWCSPIQWLVKRTQVRVRKALGIMFGGYTIANFAMFVIEEGLADSVSRPFLIASTLATLLSIPLLLTSSRWAQRKMGMKNWRKLHKLTYVIAFAIVVHVALIGEAGLSTILILAALATRLPLATAAIQTFGAQLRGDTKQAANPGVTVAGEV